MEMVMGENGPRLFSGGLLLTINLAAEICSYEI